MEAQQKAKKARDWLTKMKKKKSSIHIFKSAMFDEGVRQILEAKRENQGPVPHGQYQKISTMLTFFIITLQIHNNVTSMMVVSVTDENSDAEYLIIILLKIDCTTI